MKTHTSNRLGFSLAEALIALTILAMLAMAFTQTSLYSRRAAEANVCESTALTVAAGYLEQIKSMEYESLVASILDPNKPIETMVNQGTDDPLWLNVFTNKVVTLNEDAAGKVIQTMVVSVMPRLIDLSAPTGERILAIEVTYKWTTIDTGREVTRTMRTARSYVPTF